MITATKDDSNKQLVLIPKSASTGTGVNALDSRRILILCFSQITNKRVATFFSTDISNKVVSKRCPQYFETSSQLRFHFTLIFSFVSDYLICFVVIATVIQLFMAVNSLV